MRLFALSLLCLLSGCLRAIPVYVDSSEPKALQEAAESAVERWNEALNVDAFALDIRDNPRIAYVDLFSVIIESREHVHASESDAYTFAIGLVNHVAIEKEALSYYDAPFLEYLLTHEMGHVLGLKDLSDETNLMYQWATPGIESHHLSKGQLRVARIVAGIDLAL